MIKVNVKKTGHIVEYEISGDKFAVQRAIVDIYNQYPAEHFGTSTDEHIVTSDSEATAFMTRDRGEDEGEGSLDTAEGISNSCSPVAVAWLVVGIIIIIAIVLFRVL